MESANFSDLHRNAFVWREQGESAFQKRVLESRKIAKLEGEGERTVRRDSIGRRSSRTQLNDSTARKLETTKGLEMAS